MVILAASGELGLARSEQSAQSSEDPVLVNFIVDLDLPSEASPDLVETAKTNIFNIYNLANKYKMSWNLFLTKDAIDQTRLLLAQVALGTDQSKPVEIGISGDHLDEKLSAKSYSEQQSILKVSISKVEKLKICGINEIPAYGFLPQSFDQNEDTYRALDDLGIKYNAGFQAGILYAPGHAEDVWPYKVENHNFYAIPVSTYMLSGELVPLSDRIAKDKGISSSQWKDLLIGKLNEISGKDEPLVISLSTSISGSGDYLDALKQFTTFASSNNAEFVSSMDLINISSSGEFSESLLESSRCTTCDAATNTSLNATITNETINL